MFLRNLAAQASWLQIPLPHLKVVLVPYLPQYPLNFTLHFQ